MPAWISHPERGRVNDVTHLVKETRLLSTLVSSIKNPSRHFKVPTLSLSLSLSFSLSSSSAPYFLLLPVEVIWFPKTPVGYCKHVDRCWGHKGLVVSRKPFVSVCVCVCFFIIACSRYHNRTILWDIHMFQGIELRGVFAMFVCLNVR